MTPCLACMPAFNDPLQGPVFRLAVIVCICSLGLSLLNLMPDFENSSPVTLGVALLVIGPSIHWQLRPVSPKLGRAAMYIFLQGVVQPSTSVMIRWYRQDDDNPSCRSGGDDGSGSTHLETENGNTQSRPCIGDEFLALMDTAGYIFMVCTHAQQYISQCMTMLDKP